MNIIDFSDLAEKLVPVVKAAGRVEMDIYRQDFTVFTKKDTNPAIHELYVTMAPDKTVLAKMDPDGTSVARNDLDMQTIKTRTVPQNGLDVVASKSHMTDETRDYIEQFKVNDIKSAGSSLKFCLLARGDADLYPRFGPTMKWDTAARHAVLVAAGGQMSRTDGSAFTYGKADDKYLDPSFIASGGKPLIPKVGS